MRGWAQRLQRIQTHQTLNFILILLPWVLGSGAVWLLSQNVILAPLNDQIFETAFLALKNHRLVLHPYFIHPLLFIFSYIGPVLLVVLYGLVRYLLADFPNFTRHLLALLVVAIFYPLGAPGTMPTLLFQLLFYLLLVLPFFRRLNPLALWAVGSFSLLIAFLFPNLAFIVFWAALSLSAGSCLGFIFADQGHLPNRMRHQPIQTLFFGFGLAIFSSWVLLTSLQLSSVAPEIPLSTRWYWGFIPATLCVLLSWLYPWKTIRWMSLSLCALGILFSKSAEWLCLLILIWQILYLAKKLFEWLEDSSVWLKLSFHTLVFLFICSAVVRFQPEREFKAGWVAVAQSLLRESSEGIFVVGNGFHFLAHFLPNALFQSENILLESSEAEVVSFLKEHSSNSILVETEFLKNYWKKWIQNGKPPEVSNRSVLMRLTAYEGKAVELPTLQLPAIKSFDIIPLEKMDFVLLKLKEVSN